MAVREASQKTARDVAHAATAQHTAEPAARGTARGTPAFGGCSEHISPLVPGSPASRPQQVGFAPQVCISHVGLGATAPVKNLLR